MMNKIKICCICGKVFTDWGNNPWPVKDEGECCDICNSMFVVPARIKKMIEGLCEYCGSAEEGEPNDNT